MQTTDSSTNKTVVVLDFGATYSGYAFSSKSDFETDQQEIQFNRVWNAGSAALLSMKTPTCILLNSERKLMGVGFEAENEFAELCVDDEQHEYYFFSGFDIKKVFQSYRIIIYYISPKLSICSYVQQPSI